MNVVACKLYVIQYTAMEAHAYHAYSESFPGIPIRPFHSGSTHVQNTSTHLMIALLYFYSEALKVKQNKVSFDLGEDKKSSDEEHVFVRVSENPKEQWDCESILSMFKGDEFYGCLSLALICLF